MNLNFSLVRLLVFLCALLFGFSSMAETVIKHNPVESANSGERIPIEAQITDVSEPAKSIRLVRVYFSADSGEIKHFVPLNETEEGDQFSGLLPAPDVHTESVTYQILVVNDADEIQKSEELTIDIEADEEAAERLTSKEPTDLHVDVSLLEVFSEYAPGIDQAQVSGFQNYTVNYVSPGQAYGVTGQVVEPGSSVSGSGTGTGASSPGTYSGQVATTGAAAGVSVGVVALAGAAVAVGSGGSDGAPTPTPAPMCPAGQAGTPPDCMEPPTPMCPVGQVGTPPDCMEPPTSMCPVGQVGTPPDCMEPPTSTCSEFSEVSAILEELNAHFIDYLNNENIDLREDLLQNRLCPLFFRLDAKFQEVLENCNIDEDIYIDVYNIDYRGVVEELCQ